MKITLPIEVNVWTIPVQLTNTHGQSSLSPMLGLKFRRRPALGVAIAPHPFSRTDGRLPIPVVTSPSVSASVVRGSPLVERRGGASRGDACTWARERRGKGEGNVGDMERANDGLISFPVPFTSGL